MGFKVFLKFERHNVPKIAIDNNLTKLDIYINEALKNREYKQFGKQMGKYVKQNKTFV